MDNLFRTVLDERSPNYVMDENFNSLETGIGIKFNKFSYEIIISHNDENLAGRNAHFGGRVRYIFL